VTHTRRLARWSVRIATVGLFLARVAGPTGAGAAELVLLAAGRSDYQIVVPDGAAGATAGPGSKTATGPANGTGIDACLAQAARLLETALEANGAEVDVVPEADRDTTRPAILLGDTAAARAAGVDVTTLADWSSVVRAVGRDVVIAGRDRPAQGETVDPRRPNWDRVGTAKAAADFAREFLGVRFLYPDIPPYRPVSAAATVDLLASPAIEFLPRTTITLPADLDIRRTPLVRLNTSHPAGGGFYDLAHNRFPRVDEVFGGHTWERAVPAELFATHPEYFALVDGTRLAPQAGNAQYCLSNPAVQAAVERDLAAWFDRGYESVDLGQPDGFRPCQCEPCRALFGTGDDWGEKIWIFHRQVAERLERTHPGRQVTMMSYILTAAPPRSFTRFPANTSVMLTGTNEEDIAPWRGHDVPRGFTGYLYNWCPNLGTRYTPMRTPAFIETQVRRLAANRIQAVYRDGPGQLFGLEGPVYYAMGRMFDDPEGGRAQDLQAEFVTAAFGTAAPAMQAFYDRLYHAIMLYSDHLGTRCDLWTYRAADGRPRKSVGDPFQLIAFLYPPAVLAALDDDLARAERAADSAKARTRLTLVRTEFDWLRHLARVVHLHHAYQVEPDGGSRDRLLAAIDARNAFLAALYDERGRPVPVGTWSHVLFPFAGHDVNHLRLAHDGYQEPYADTCLNWDTAAMRELPPPTRQRVTAVRATGPVGLDAAAWNDVPAQVLTILPPFHGRPRRTVVKFMHDAERLHVRAECELAPDGPAEFPAAGRDRDLRGQESLDLCLAPRPDGRVSYRFQAGPHAESRFDAVRGLVTEAMDPRYGRDDTGWNGDWQCTTRVDREAGRWHALVTIPFRTLEVEPPAPGTVWHANIGRAHLLPRGRVDRSIWSSTPRSFAIDDPAVWGEIAF
jgi:hypothetical protein